MSDSISIGWVSHLSFWHDPWLPIGSLSDYSRGSQGAFPSIHDDATKINLSYAMLSGFGRTVLVVKAKR